MAHETQTPRTDEVEGHFADERVAESHDRGTEASHFTPRNYVYVGIILTLITALELWMSYADLGGFLIPALLIASAIKFGIVVAYFMHLRFDAGLLTRLFVFAVLLAGSILIALLALFWTDADFRVRDEVVATLRAAAGV